MEEFLWGILRISIFGSLSAMLLLVLQPVIRRLAGRSVVYYLWLLVLLRLCIPVGITVTLPSVADTDTRISDGHTRQVTERAGQPTQKGTAAPALEPGRPKGTSGSSNGSGAQLYGRLDIHGLCLFLWALGVLIFLGWHVWVGLRFSHRVRESMSEVPAEALALLREAGPAGRVGLAGSSLVDTPMLLGCLHPVIVLPANVGDKDPDMLKDIIAHELVHAKRRDLFYKWAVLVVTSLHWFNPLMILIRREIGRSCELSCDEAVMRGMDADGRRHYGETLLAMAGAPPAGTKTMTVTLCEEKKQLKERLVSIAGYQKKGIKTMLLSILPVLAVGGCAMISDAKINGADDGRGQFQTKSGMESLAEHTKGQDTGTENTEEQDIGTGNNDTGIEDEEEGYLAVLTGKQQFLYHGEGGQDAGLISIADIPDIFHPGSSDTEIYEFAVADLDSDGTEEVLLRIIDAAGDMGGYMLLRQGQGGIHGYMGSYRAFMELKTDGTFTYSSPTGLDTGIGTVQFQEQGYNILPIACSETSQDQETVTYQVDQAQASEEEYLAAMEQHREKTDVVWYLFTDENIRELFAPSSQEDSTGGPEEDAPETDTDEGLELYYVKDGRQYELVEDLVTGQYLWANVLTLGDQDKDSQEHTEHDLQERYFERLDGKETYAVRRWDSLLYSAGGYLIFSYNNTVHVSKSTDIYHPVLSYPQGGTYGIVTKVPNGYMIADERSYEIRFYDEQFKETKVKTGLRAGENGDYYQDGLMAVRDMETGLMGYMDQEGKLAVPCSYAAVSDFSNGYASVLADAKIVPYTEDAGTVQMYLGKGGQWGIIDKKGRFVVEPSREYANEDPKDPDAGGYVPGIRYFGPIRADGTVDFLAADQEGRVLKTIRVW